MERWLRLFELTHEIDGHDGLVRVSRTALPGPGGIGEQDAKDLEAMELMRTTFTRVLGELAARRRIEHRTEEWREQRAEQRRRGEL